MARTPITVAVVTDGALRAYYRNGHGTAEQVAQLLVGRDIDPSAIATIVADLGDVLGWGAAAGGTPQPKRLAGRVAGALPAATAGTRRPPEQVDAERAAALDVIAARPGIRRAELADALGLDRHVVKRVTDALLAAGAIDARPLPGVRERGPGGGHGLFPMQRAD